MRNFKQAFILVLVVIFSNALTAQSKLVNKIRISLGKHEVAATAFKAISFKFPEHLEGRLKVEVAGKIFQLRADDHSAADDGFFISTLLVFDHWQSDFRLLGLEDNDSVTAYLISNPPIKLPFFDHKTHLENCDPPPMISQEIWRKGLPEPDYSRIPNEVEHQIIHHSASQNELSDHTNLVRSIYLYHTEVNGWSDIGYNYLVAPDGSVFAGRDPGEKLSQDEVLGAHFCGSNSSTMGICMLGTFDTVAPTAEAMQALEQLVVWKSAKEILDPLAQLPHPLNQNLATIAGHRDGCATLCPGGNLYALLPVLRQQTLKQLHNCAIYPNVSESNELSQIRIFPNPVEDAVVKLQSAVTIKEIVMYSIDGKELKKWQLDQKEVALTIPELSSGGFFLLKVILANQLVITRKLVVRPF